MRRHILLLPDIADGGFECVSLRLIIPHDRVQMQMDTEAGGQKKNVSEPTDLDSKTSSYSLFVLEKMERIKRSTHLT